MSLVGSGLVGGWRRGHAVVERLDVAVEPGRVLGIAGPSGCGKSTLVRMLALLHTPWRGTVAVDGTAVPRMRYRAPAALRRRVGVVFQQPRAAADPRLTLTEILTEPLRAAGERDRAVLDARAAELSDRVGLTAELRTRRPHEVSDGQLQRACLARALAAEPDYLLCDEMTAMLDASTTAALVSVIGAEVDRGLGVLTVSHDEPLLAAWADEVLRPW
ncbi:ABC transporter ATP-binding protein [Actinomycetospora termitidis]|uniref:ATP-binding cassette domain-containing protein n=1 Tax=Actinomycetospora termitidis TaxID=3053470 RepID=A0ABT7M759_9PSEU|nr:ATP-binding cassette domain-containing protein [Actinomycetospora sp. Odt1-22]MDL5156503.1 ATP-binding cassette domain-containing protein [Actinomycetospora sp. Odt1-22]